MIREATHGMGELGVVSWDNLDPLSGSVADSLLVLHHYLRIIEKKTADLPGRTPSRVWISTSSYCFY